MKLQNIEVISRSNPRNTTAQFM